MSLRHTLTDWHIHCIFWTIRHIKSLEYILGEKYFMVFNTVEWFRHILITDVFLLSKKSPWRQPHEWPKHGGDDNTILFTSRQQDRGQLYTPFSRREMPLTFRMCGACQWLITIVHIHTDDGDKAGLCNAILNSTIMWLSEDFSDTYGKFKTIWNVS